MTTAISLSESKKLIELERTIEAGRKTFIEVGNALAEIRDSKLYRADYKTFDDYCKDKWGWSRIRAHQLIEASEVSESLPKEMLTIVNNEGKARELSKVEPAQREQVVLNAKAKADSEDRPITAKDISEAAQKVKNIGFCQKCQTGYKLDEGHECEKWTPGGAPIQPREHAPEDDESDAIFGLKRYWKKATKKERKEFLKWTETQ